MTLLRENSSERGKNTLSCVFSRLVKSATDIAANTSSKVSIRAYTFINASGENVARRENV